MPNVSGRLLLLCGKTYGSGRSSSALAGVIGFDGSVGCTADHPSVPGTPPGPGGPPGNGGLPNIPCPPNPGIPGTIPEIRGSGFDGSIHRPHPSKPSGGGGGILRPNASNPLQGRTVSAVQIFSPTQYELTP